MNSMLKWFSVGAMAIGMSIAGCESMSESEKADAKAQRVSEAAEIIRKGEGQMADGKAMEARGRAMNEQSQQAESDRLIAEGRAMQKSGQSLIDQGKAMRDR
jgi:hypothetical protein